MDKSHVMTGITATEARRELYLLIDETSSHISQLSLWVSVTMLSWYPKNAGDECFDITKKSK